MIGGNLAVAGLVTAGNLQANTVQTTTMVPNAATVTAGRQSVGYQITSPTQVYAGFDGLYYVYQTANVVPGGVNITCTTNSVTNVISGYIDVYGSTTVNGASTIIPQMYAQLFRVVGANTTAVGGSFITTPAYDGYTGAGSSWQTAQAKLPYRLNEVSLIDTFTITAPQVVTYLWLFGSYVNVTSNVAPTQDYIGIDATGGYSLTVTNFRR